MRDRARRFISLLDELYNARTQLVISAAAPPHALFQRPGDVPILDLEGLQFETAVEGGVSAAIPCAPSKTWLVQTALILMCSAPLCDG